MLRVTWLHDAVVVVCCVLCVVCCVLCVVYCELCVVASAMRVLNCFEGSRASGAEAWAIDWSACGCDATPRTCPARLWHYVSVAVPRA